MAKYKNSFALLDDEEGDDVRTLVDHIIKKVDNTSMHAQNLAQSSDFVREEGACRRGGQGRRDVSRGSGHGWDDDSQGSYGRGSHRRNYSRDSYGSSATIKDNGGWYDESRGRGRDFGSEGVNEAAGGDTSKTDNDDLGWQDVKRSNGKRYAVNGNSSEHGHRGFGNGDQRYGGGRRGYGDEVRGGLTNGQRGYRNGNQSYEGGNRRGYRDQTHSNNDAADDRRRFSNGNRSDNGERTYQGDQVRNSDAAADGRRRFQNGGRRGNGYHVQADGVGSEQVDMNGETNGDNKFKGEVKTYRNGNQNYGGERRGYGGYRGRGRRDNRRGGSGEVKETVVADDGHDVKSEHVNGSEGDGAVVVEDSKVAETEEKNNVEEVSGGNRKAKKEADLLTKEELERKKEEEKEAALMTLDEYEKLLMEKRQALESRKTEERRVALDKELEGMRLIERKQDDTDDKQKSEAKLKKKSSLENKEKGRKLVGQEALELFKPAFRSRTRGGSRGEGRGGRGRGFQGGFSGQSNPRTYVYARARQHAPTDRDFPVLSSFPAH